MALHLRQLWQDIRSALRRGVSKLAFWKRPKKIDVVPLAELPPPPKPEYHGETPRQEESHACPAYMNLKRRFRDVGRLAAIGETLGRDYLTAMPDGAYQSRLGQIAFLFRRMHDDMTEEKAGLLIDEAKAHEFVHPEDWDEWDAANLREMERMYHRYTAIDGDLMERKARMEYTGRRTHRNLLRANNWEEAAPFLEEIINIHRHVGGIMSEARGLNDPYQALMQDHMPWMNVAEVDGWFDTLEKKLKKLVPKVLEKQQEDDEPLRLSGIYPAEAQMWLNRSLLKVIGFDFDRGGLYETGHNPVEGGTPEDTRLVISFIDPGNFLDSMKSALHEGGHGIYIQGLPRDTWRYQPVGQDLGAAVQESQALLIEMIICRTKEFFTFLAPRLEGLFQGIHDPALQPENLYRLKSRVRPSPNRKQADELTYFFHILLRYRIEKRLINGTLSVADLPDAWAAEMQDLIGFTPSSVREGPLQDVHWFVGKFGYFPAYAIGHMMAAQIFEAMSRDLPDLLDLIGRGDFKPIRNWLGKNIYRKGRLLDSRELIKTVTGKPLSPDYLVKHLENRFLKEAI